MAHSFLRPWGFLGFAPPKVHPMNNNKTVLCTPFIRKWERVCTPCGVYWMGMSDKGIPHPDEDGIKGGGESCSHTA